MKNFLILSLFLTLAAPLFADVSFITVNDEAAYEEVEDFSNTYEINFNRHGEKKINKCQAVRLKEHWFITAAHCVENACRDNCSFQARLIVGPNYEADMTVTHTPKSPKIFKHSKAKLDKRSSSYDLALLYFKPSETKVVYKDMLIKRALTEAQFLERIPNKSLFYKAVKGTNIPNLLVMNEDSGKKLDRKISVISIWDGKREVMNNTDGLIYSPKQHLFFTKNFGIIKGISGSGVMTNTGELAAIVSAIGSIGLYNSATKKYDPVHMAYLSAFDQEVVDFIHEHAGSFGYIEAGPEYLQELNPKQKELLNAMDGLSLLKQ